MVFLLPFSATYSLSGKTPSKISIRKKKLAIIVLISYHHYNYYLPRSQNRQRSSHPPEHENREQWRWRYKVCIQQAPFSIALSTLGLLPLRRLGCAGWRLVGILVLNSTTIHFLRFGSGFTAVGLFSCRGGIMLGEERRVGSTQLEYAGKAACYPDIPCGGLGFHGA